MGFQGKCYGFSRKVLLVSKESAISMTGLGKYTECEQFGVLIRKKHLVTDRCVPPEADII